MRNILILGNSDQGLYKFRKEIIKELVMNNYTVTVSTPHGIYIPLLEDCGCRYIEVGYDRKSRNLLSNLKLIYDYYKMINSGKYDIVLLYTIKPSLYAGTVCRRKGIPYIVNVTGLGPALTSNKVVGAFFFRWYQYVLSTCNKVYFQNEAQLCLFREKHLVKENYKLIPGSGVNLKEYDYCDYDEDEKLTILYVGRITKVKGIDELLRAVEIVSQEQKNICFELLGECDEQYNDRLDSLQKEGKLTYYGYSDNAKAYMARANAVIMPSYGEGMSNVLLEASAMGRPVLASDVSGCREIVEDGVTGFIFEPRSAEAVVHAVKRFRSLTREERAAMGKAGREYVEDNFSRELIVKEYMSQIKKICEER